MRPAQFFIGLICLALLPSGRVWGQEGVDYLRDIKPLLSTHCYACHGALKQSGGLRLDTVAFALAGGDSGPAVSEQPAGVSLLLERVTSADPELRMPPEGKPLPADKIELLKRWLATGVTAVSQEQPQADPLSHWAFVAPQQRLPEASAGSDNPIDLWLSHEQQQLTIQPLPSASQHDLLRRVTLDLIGIPPTIDELQAFTSDSSPDAFQRVVERLLARPEYGERWGRHWMDVWRYSDWYGRRAVPDVMNSYPQIWRWRDWIVRSLNEDKGYDQMVMQMIAADELTPTDPDNVVATGFIVRNWYKWNYETWMKDSVEHTGKAFLGLTLNCAMCHDHKYDPITQEDYFRFRAFFEPLELRHERVAGQPDPGPFKKYVYAESYGPITSGAIRIFDEKLDAQTVMFRGGDARNRIEGRPPVDCGPPRQLTREEFNIEPVSLPVEAAYPGLQAFIREEELRKLQAERELKHQQLQSAQTTAKLASDDFQKLQTLAQGPKTAANYPNPAQLVQAQQATHDARLSLQIQQAAADLADARVECFQLRVAADDAQWRGQGDASALAKLACASEHHVEHLAALQANLAAEQALQQAQRKEAEAPADKADQVEAAKKLVKTASDQLSASRAALEAARTKLTHNDGQYQPLSPKYPAQSTGRRTALAKWLTSPDNTLTARVAVNHMWMRHFGQPLVESVDNFGIQGKAPKHPELLDWLAVELVRQNWSMKALHRLIVTSQAYQRSSRVGSLDHPNYALDRDNRTLWHFPTRRMEAEVVRDSFIACSGALDRRQGGPEIVTEDATKTPRRSLYFVIHGEAQMLFLNTFDGANVCDCYRRTSTVLPSQALALTNSDMLVHYARLCAARLHAQVSSQQLVDTSSNSEFVRLAFTTCLNRPPDDEELQASLEFLARLESANLTDSAVEAAKPDASGWTIQQPAADSSLRARENLVMALFNHNDFVTIR